MKAEMLQFSKENRIVAKKEDCITYSKDKLKTIFKYSRAYFDCLEFDQEANYLRDFDKVRSYISSVKVKLNQNGFKNKDIFCYLNAVIQLLVGIRSFVDIFLHNPIYSNLIKKGPVSQKFKKILVKNEKEDKNCFSIIDILKLFSKKLDFDIQQDSHEMMRLLLDKMHEELRPKLQGKQRYKYSWDNFKVHQVSPISSLFYGEQTRRTLCFNCFKFNIKRSEFSELSLPVKDCFDTIEDSITSYFEPELVEDYYCSHCKVKSPSSSKISITHLPKYLTLHLLRFCYFPYPKKVNHALGTEKEDVLDMSSFKEGSGVGRYKLKGSIIHTGNINNGHYTCYSNRNGKWFYFDDEDIYKSRLELVLTRQPYIMLYELMED